MFSQDALLEYHLEHNHYPPMTRYFHLAKEAIVLGRLDGWDSVVEHKFPEVKPNITAAEIVSGLHLEEFIMEEV